MGIKDPEKNREYQRLWARKNAIKNRDHILEIRKRYRQKNKEILLQYGRLHGKKFRENNKEKIKLYKSMWCVKNMEKIRAARLREGRKKKEENRRKMEAISEIRHLLIKLNRIEIRKGLLCQSTEQP